MISIPWSRAALLVVLFPLAAAAQVEPRQDAPERPHFSRGWTGSPLEAVLERSAALGLTPAQMDRIRSEVERWRTEAAEPLAVLGRHAQARAESRPSMSERREAMAERREAMAERRREMGERREEMGERSEEMEGRREVMRERRRGMRTGPRPAGPELTTEGRTEIREAMGALRDLRRGQVEVLQEVLTEDQLQRLREDRASLRGSGMWRGSPRHRGPQRPGRNHPR